jgi:hypothetical protein
MPQRDLMLGWIEQVAQLVAGLLDGPSPDLAQASDKVEEALAQHLGNLAPLIPQLDVASASMLLNEPERIFGYAQLLSAQAAVARSRGLETAPGIEGRALALARVALARATDPPSSWRSWIEEMESAHPFP